MVNLDGGWVPFPPLKMGLQKFGVQWDLQYNAFQWSMARFYNLHISFWQMWICAVCTLVWDVLAESFGHPSERIVRKISPPRKKGERAKFRVHHYSFGFAFTFQFQLLYMSVDVAWQFLHCCGSWCWFQRRVVCWRFALVSRKFPFNWSPSYFTII